MDNIKEVAEIVVNSEAIVITAGAGIGVDSGLPDFRGNEGFWTAYPQLHKLGCSFVDMASPDRFETKPELAWAFYGHRLNLYRETIPHKGFSQLLEIANSKKFGYFVFTSNVDGQFQKSGFNEDRINECHGSIHYFQCSYPCTDDIWAASHEQVDVDMDVFEAQGILPLCPHCGAIARPNILMFGDISWIGLRSGVQSNGFTDWLFDVSQKTEKIVVIELGAGKDIPSVRLRSESIISQFNAKLIRINPRDFDVPKGHYALKTGAAEGMQAIIDNM